MKKTVSFVLFFVIALSLFPMSSVASESAEAVILTAEEYSIVLPNSATQVEETAAYELQNYLNLLTGGGECIDVIYEIDLPSDAQKAIYIGATDYAAANNIFPVSDENWIIKAVGDDLVVTGGAQRGVLYAAYHLLEDVFGVHWWNIWNDETVPSLTELSFPEGYESSGTPAFEYRDIYNSSSIVNDSLFHVRNRLNGHYTDNTVKYGDKLRFGDSHSHTTQYYVPSNSTNMQLHPTWFALKSDGTRDSGSGNDGQLCLSNTEVQAEFLNGVRNRIILENSRAINNGYAKPVYFSVSMNDSEVVCQCSSCQASVTQSGLSGHILKFVNRIADDIATDYPDIRIETIVYWNYVEPPLDDTVPSDNVVVRIADNYMDLLHNLNHANNSNVLRRLNAWKTIVPEGNLYIWDYAINYSDNPPFPTMFNYASKYKTYKDADVAGIFIEHQRPFTTDFWDMKQWMLSKLMENPYQDEQALMDTFLYGFYGSAGGYIKQYLNLVKADALGSSLLVNYGTDISGSYISLGTAIQGSELFDNAMIAVEGDSNLEARVRLARCALDRIIALRFSDFKNAARYQGMSSSQFSINKNVSAQRVVNCLEEQISLHCLCANHASAPNSYCKPAVEQINKYSLIAAAVDPEDPPMPAELSNISMNNLYQVLAPNFTAYINTNHGCSYVTDSDSLTGKTLKMTAADMLPERRNDYYTFDNNTKKLTIFTNTGVSNQKVEFAQNQLNADGQYHIYTLENAYGTKINGVTDTMVFVFKSELIKVNLTDVYKIMPYAQGGKYKVHVSMKFTGAMYNGLASDEDAMYIDRIIIEATK